MLIQTPPDERLACIGSHGLMLNLAANKSRGQADGKEQMRINA
ncbi:MULTISPECIES: hypothetical protein [Chromobacterium]|nr:MULTISPECIES: hypothetical protein [Chromobacterium]WON84486.1 hypothetical protein OK026_02920 [Chromobacterium haemolyticum]